MHFTDCVEQDFNYLNRGTQYSYYLNQILVFEGVYNKPIGNLITHYEKQTFSVNITDRRPHSFFQDKVYLSIDVTDNSGVKTYERIVKGLTNISFDEVPMAEGFIINIYHLEAPARLISRDGIAYTGINRTTHRFLVTRYGLKNLELGNNPLFTFLQRLHQNAGELHVRNTYGSENLRNLLVGARSLPQPYRTEFVMKYNQVMSECGMVYVMANMGDDSIQGSIVVSTRQGLQELVGTVVSLKNGEDIVLQDTVEPFKNMFQYVGVPYGVYTVEFRGGGAEAYIITPQYVEVRDSINPILFNFIRIDDSLLVNSFPLDDQLMYINSKANEIAMSPLKSRVSLFLSDEKKLLLAAIRSLPADRSGFLFNKYGNLFSNQPDEMRDNYRNS